MRNIKVHTRPVEIGQEMSPLEVESGQIFRKPKGAAIQIDGE